MLKKMMKQLGLVAKEPAPSKGAVARVSRGADLLDAQQPNWWMMVRPEEVDLLSPSLCVLGQVYGTFSRALNKIHPLHGDHRLSDFGFCPQETDTVTVTDEMLDLKRAWKLAIEARRAAAGVR